MFLVFVRDIPGRKQVSTSLGSADDFRFLASSKKLLEDCERGNEGRCDENKKAVKSCTSKLLNIKIKLRPSINKEEVGSEPTRRVFGLIVVIRSS